MKSSSSSKLILVVVMLVLFCQQAMAEDLQNPRRKGLNPVLKSALIPGWGELSMDKKSGYAFLALEAILWGTKYYTIDQEDISARKAFIYAVENAQINPELDFEEDYLDLLKKYNNSGFEPGGYNFVVMQQALSLYPDDSEMQESYVSEHGISDAYAWDWESFEARKYYAGRRTDILDYADAGKAITGVILANHLLSVINTAIGSKKAARLTSHLKLDKDLNPGLELTYIF